MALVAVLVVAGFHYVAYLIIAPFAAAKPGPDKLTLVTLSGAVFLSCSLMLSQSMESVTRAFYARADLDLILSSPASARRLFAVRMLAIAFATAALTLVLAGPFINVLALYDGAHWLSAYGVLGAMAALSTALAILVTVVLFRTLGPRRTRLVSQIVSAVVGAAFIIGVQAAAILSTGSFSRFAFFRSEDVVAAAPEESSLLWWPARAALGDGPALAIVMLLGLLALFFVIHAFSLRFGDYVLSAAGVPEENRKTQRPLKAFRAGSPARVLRRKEWALLRRDPWLLSQTLMQILYLLPPALLLWRKFGDDTGALLVMVPILVMASGQLAGGLAWLAVSGEDAPDLVATAPLAKGAVIRAKIQAVIGAVAMVVLPLLLALTLASLYYALIAGLGILLAAGSGTMIQIWFRAQAKRSNFRRRQTSSRLATLAEALCSIFWAGTAALVAAGTWLAAGTAILALLTLLGIWLVRPRDPASI